MNFVENEKKVVFLCPGPEYLFWAVGVYFAWELSRTYRVVLIADNFLKDLNRVRQLINKGILYDFVQFEVDKGSFLGLRRVYRRHKFSKQVADEIFEKYNSVAIIQHTDLEPANIHLFEKAEAKKNLRIMYRSSTIAKDYYADYLLLKGQVIGDIQNTFRISHRIASILFHVRKYFSYYFNYSLMPLFFTGHVFKPRIRAICHKKDFFNKNRGYFDFAITYSQREKLITEANGEPSTVVRNPLNSIGDEANDFIYGRVSPSNKILILPTSGEIEHVKKNKGLPEADLVDYFATQWVKAIDIIQNKFKGWETGFKLHQRQTNDYLFHQVVKSVTSSNNSIKVISNQESAEKLILESRVIVGTMSSTLWWASELRSRKLVISLDLWGIPGGDRYSDVKRIHYFKGLDELSVYNFSDCCFDGEYQADGPTLTEFVKAHILA